MSRLFDVKSDHIDLAVKVDGVPSVVSVHYMQYDSNWLQESIEALSFDLGYVQCVLPERKAGYALNLFGYTGVAQTPVINPHADYTCITDNVKHQIVLYKLSKYISSVHVITFDNVEVPIIHPDLGEVDVVYKSDEWDRFVGWLKFVTEHLKDERSSRNTKTT